MLESELLQVTGRGTNINFTIDDQKPFTDVLSSLKTYLSKNRHLFSKGNVTVNVGQRVLNKDQLTEIKQALESGSGLNVAQFWCSPDIFSENPSANEPFEANDISSLSKSAGAIGSMSSDTIESKSPESNHGTGDLLPSTTENIQPSKTTYLGEVGLEESEIYIFENSPEEILLADQSETEGLTETYQILSKENNAIVDETAALSSLQNSTGEPVVEPGPLELALIGLEQSIQNGLIDNGNQQNLGNVIADEETEPFVTYNADINTSVNREIETIGLNRQNEALLIKTTCRSGEVVRYAGDVIVLADVNPGAQIIADGDILVFGSLRGFAHAGATGDLQATIIALSLDTSRVQIGPYIGIAPKNSEKGKYRSQQESIAYIRRQHIFVSPFNGRYARYSGGTLYDG